MNFSELSNTRRSVHNFKPGVKISKEAFEKIITDASKTPSGYNAQPWHCILIQNEKTLEQISEIAFGQKHIKEAGNAVLIIGNTHFGTDDLDRICAEWKTHKNYTDEQIKNLKNSLNKTRSPEQWKSMTLRNASMFAMSLLYSAQSHGWDTCPMMGFSQQKIKTLLSIPDKYIPILLVALGKADPKDTDTQFPRKSPDDLISYEQFTQTKKA